MAHALAWTSESTVVCNWSRSPIVHSSMRVAWPSPGSEPVGPLLQAPGSLRRRPASAAVAPRGINDWNDHPIVSLLPTRCVAQPARIRWRRILYDIRSAGFDALPIVGLSPDRALINSGNMAPTSLLPISSFVDAARVRALDHRHHRCRAFGLRLRRADRHDGRDRGDRETKVNYAVVGALVLVLGAVLIVGVLWLASGGA